MAREPVPGTPRLLRALNDRAALDLMITHGPLTRARLGELTGLSKVTASQLLGRLESAGLVRTVGSQTGGRGPNAMLYAVDGRAGLAVGVDIDPARAKARVVDAVGAVLGQATVAQPRSARAHDPAGDVLRVLDEAAADAGVHRRLIRTAVIGVQGAYDPQLDALTYAAHLPAWSRPGLLGALTAAAGCPVTIENDVNLAAAADLHSAAAAAAAADHRGPPGPGSSAYFWLGDGLGLAIHFGDVLYRGAHGGAGEVGYIPVAGDGGRGPSVQLQELVGAAAVLALAQAHRAPGRTAAAAVGRAVSAPAADAVATAFLSDLADRIATGLATVTAVLDPGEVVLAGPVGTAGGELLAALVLARLHERSPMRPHVRAGAAHTDPVLGGACALALHGLREQLFSTTTTGAAAREGAKA